MAIDPIERAVKLLRLAASSSNGTKAERASAALEAADVIDKNDLTVARKPKKRASGLDDDVWRMIRIKRPGLTCSINRCALFPGNLAFLDADDHIVCDACIHLDQFREAARHGR